MATKKLHHNVDKIFVENKKHCTEGTSVLAPSDTKTVAWLRACVFGPKEIG